MNKIFIKKENDWIKILERENERLKFLIENQMTDLEVKEMFMSGEYEDFSALISQYQFRRLTVILGNPIFDRVRIDNKVAEYQRAFSNTKEEIVNYISEIKSKIFKDLTTKVKNITDPNEILDLFGNENGEVELFNEEKGKFIPNHLRELLEKHYNVEISFWTDKIIKRDQETDKVIAKVKTPSIKTTGGLGVLEDSKSFFRLKEWIDLCEELIKGDK